MHTTAQPVPQTDNEVNFMNTSNRNLIIVALISALGAGTAYAASGSIYPDEVKSSSIKLPKGTAKDQASLSALATVSQAQAEAAALAAQPDGKVIKSKLEKEDGYLVWQVDVEHGTTTTQFSVDPGTGQILAAEADENDDEDHDDKK
jgi:uncharacterized membrane protein YkoI